MLAFAPFGLHPLALLTFALLIQLWMQAPPRRCAWLGFGFGCGLYLAGVSWVYVSLHTFGGMPVAIAGIATVGFCTFLALFPAAAGWLQARIPASDALRACLVIPAAWVLFEWILVWLFTGFPWMAVGYSAAGWPLQGYAPLGGVYLVSFLTVSVAGMLWLIVRHRPRYLLFAVAVLGIGETLRHVAWTERAGEPVTVALLQGNIEQEMKFRRERYAAIAETYARLADGSQARLIVTPETALPRFLHQVEPAYLERLEGIARRNGGDLILGVPSLGPKGSDYYNSVVTLGVSPRRAYDKVHLVPFGEFIPSGFGWVLRWLEIPLSDFKRGGRAQRPLAIAGQRIAVNICYEDAFGDEIAARAANATMLVNASNVAWFGDSLAPAQHLQIARLRAIETGRMHLTATNTGITAAIDRNGRVLAQLPQFTEARLEIAAQGYSGDTPYMQLRDWPIVVLSLAILGFFTLRARFTR